MTPETKRCELCYAAPCVCEKMRMTPMERERKQAEIIQKHLEKSKKDESKPAKSPNLAQWRDWQRRTA